MAHHPIPEIGILDVEQFIECHPRRFVGVGEALVEPPPEQAIELARTAAGTPAQAFEAGIFHQMAVGARLRAMGPRGNPIARKRAPTCSYQTPRRWTISFLISAIAFAGFRPFGQVRAQFMIVWQR
ncbi:MAG: hypothetical protein GAK28_00465 [Luteibacter sp.]|nr:MAG: hypothetical protein GAK28_00465 [Luteibacter sp.]